MGNGGVLVWLVAQLSQLFFAGGGVLSIHRDRADLPMWEMAG